MKKLALILILIFSSQIFAQNEAVAYKVDEYKEEKTVDLKLLDEKITMFLQEIRKTPPTTKGVILVFPSLKELRCFNEKKFSSDVRQKYLSKLLTKNKDVVSRITVESVSSYYRENTQVEFWIVPQNAERNFGGGIIADCFCPSLNINDVLSEDKKELHLAAFSSDSSSRKFKYDWQILQGKIISGQGTFLVIIDVSNVTSKEIVIKLRVFGQKKNIEKECGDSVIKTVKFDSKNSQ